VSAGTTPAAFDVRFADIDDLEAIMRIETAEFVNDAWSRQSMAHELANPSSVYLVATPADEPDRIVAYAGLLAPPRSPDADIQTIAVAPPARRQGLARLLMTTLIETARDRGAREVFLEVRVDNPAAQDLYVSLDFEEIAVRPKYYMPDGVDASVMRLTLGPTGPTTSKGTA